MPRCALCDDASPGLTAGRGLKPAHRAVLIACSNASPGLTAGRGLKPGRHDSADVGRHASPGLTAGRGLKHPDVPGDFIVRVCIARPHGRARIETQMAGASRISLIASPGLTAGRGLKPDVSATGAAATFASPGLTAGRGLKPTGAADAGN